MGGEGLAVQWRVRPELHRIPHPDRLKSVSHRRSMVRGQAVPQMVKFHIFDSVIASGLE